MPYPKKISRETILEQAMAFIENHGLAELSMRTLATSLGVTPNALYRYFASKADLEFAMADEGGLMLLTALREATEGKPPHEAIVDAARAYIRFARQNPQLYAVKMRHSKGDESQQPASHNDVWGFVTAMAEGLHAPWNAEDLAVSLWAFLHGIVELDSANLLEGRTPEAAMETGLAVMLAGLMTQAIPRA